MATQPIAKGGGLTSSQKGWSQAGGYIMPSVGAIVGLGATMSDIDMKNDVLMTNMQNEAESLLYSQGVSSQKLDDLDRVLGDKLSANGLEAMKSESRLKAASAETGGTGGSNTDAINTAQVNKLHKNASVIRSADVAKANTQSQMVAQRLGFENTLDSMMSGQQSALSAGLETLSAGLRGLTLGTAMLSDSGKEYAYGTNTTGNKG